MKLALLAFVFILGNAFAQTPVRPINTNLPTLFIAGDSTASNVDHRGWGDPFADCFDLSKINVANRARAAAPERFWKKVYWAAKKRGLNRSSWLRYTATRELDKEEQ